MKKYKVMIEDVIADNSLPHWANLIYDKEITITIEKDLTFDEILSRVYDELEVFTDTPDVWEGEYELEISVEGIEGGLEMTSREALERLKFIADKELNIGSKSYNDLQEFWNYKEPLKVIEELVERDTPKKVEIGTSKDFKYPICPNCKVELYQYYKNKYCKECGQRLNWNIEE